MDRTHHTRQIIICPSNEPYYRRHHWGHYYPEIRPGQCGCKSYTKCLLILCASTLLSVGFILTMIGHFKKPFWYPVDDWRCTAYCRERRLEEERNLKNCRVVGPIFLAIGSVFLCASIFYYYYYFDYRVKRKSNQGHVIREPTTGQMGTTSQGGTGTATASTTANNSGYQQSYVQSPANPLGPYSDNPPLAVAESYSRPTRRQVYPPAQHPYPPQDGQEAQPYQADIPPPPSYESVVDQSTPSPSTSAPTLV